MSRKIISFKHLQLNVVETVNLSIRYKFFRDVFIGLEMKSFFTLIILLTESVFVHRKCFCYFHQTIFIAQLLLGKNKSR